MFTVNTASTESANQEFNAKINMFTPGQAFTINSAKVVDTVFQDNHDPKKVTKSIQVVFDTTLGDLFFASLRRITADKDGKIHKPSGTFIDDFMKALLALKPEDGQTIITNQAAANQLTAAFKGKTVKIDWEEFIRQNKDGYTYPAHIMLLNY